MAQTDRPLGRVGAAEHILQLFDTEESLVKAVSAFLHEGWEGGNHLVVIARPRHWHVLSQQLLDLGCPVPEAFAQKRLTVLDAHALLSHIMRGPAPDEQQFHQTIGAVVARRAAEGPGGVRIYGEIVEVLAEEGNFDAARQLETFWNDLRERHQFALLCGYFAAHFAQPADAASLCAITDAHTQVHFTASDVLGSWLQKRSRAARGLVQAT